MARSGARTGTTANRRRRLLVVLPLVVVFYAVALPMLSAGPHREGAFFAAIALCLIGTRLLRPVVLCALMLLLGARPTYLRVGLGRFVGARIVPSGVLSLRAVPITMAGEYLPRLRHYRRDLRICYAAIVLSPIPLSLLWSLLLPPYVRVLCLVIGLTASVGDLVTRQRDSGRALGARAFLRATKETDPALADPARAHLTHGLIAARSGDLEGAAEQIEHLTGLGYDGVVAIEAFVHRVRGDYAAAARIYAEHLTGPAHELTPSSTPAEKAARAAARRIVLPRYAFAVLLVAERDPSLQPQAAQRLDRVLAELGGEPDTPDAVAVHALKALIDGDTRRCLELTRRQLEQARNPLAVADALCTRARAQAAAGRTEDARTTVRRLERSAPWYARTAVVQQLLAGLLGERIGAVGDPAAVDVAAEARLFDDPWSTSTR